MVTSNIDNLHPSLPKILPALMTMAVFVIADSHTTVHML
jgi:hypothetical protein